VGDSGRGSLTGSVDGPGSRRGWLLVAVLTLWLTWVPGAAAADTQRVGAVAAIPARARALGALPANRTLEVTLALKPQDPAALAAYASAVATPGNPDYQHDLSVAQFAQRFGASSASSAAVIASLRSSGLDPGPVSANGLSVSLSASAAQITPSQST
jgi:kumamolisin